MFLSLKKHPLRPQILGHGRSHYILTSTSRWRQQCLWGQRHYPTPGDDCSWALAALVIVEYDPVNKYWFFQNNIPSPLWQNKINFVICFDRTVHSHPVSAYRKPSRFTPLHQKDWDASRRADAETVREKMTIKRQDSVRHVTWPCVESTVKSGSSVRNASAPAICRLLQCHASLVTLMLIGICSQIKKTGL
jgi:hypothetical protein